MEGTDHRHVIKVDRRHCPHCQCLVSVKTFKIHKRLFYDEERKLWNHRDSDGGHSDIESDCSSPPLSVNRDDLELMDSDIASPPDCLSSLGKKTTTVDMRC